MLETDAGIETATTDREAELLAQIAGLQAELERSQRMAALGVLSSSITHEFNNVLTTVINYAQLGLRKKDDDAARERAFSKILAAGRRAAEITTGMLALARGDRLERHPADLSLLARQVLVLVEKDLQKHRIALHVDWADPSPWASVHAAQLQQVVLNLVLNARQAMEPGGSLLVQTAWEPDDAGQATHQDDGNQDDGNQESRGTAVLAIRDTGCGIEPERLPTIFEPFASTKTADADGQGGTGLGLATCRKIVEAHEGRIRVESAMGRGTTFSLRLPAVAARIGSD